MNDYRAFLEAKRPIATAMGITIADVELHPNLSAHAREVVKWAIPGGRRAIFAKFGLHKTRMQLEISRRIIERQGGAALIVAPLGVRLDFRIDADALGIPLTFGQTDAEMDPTGVNLTNYESVREGKIDLNRFTVINLDEAAVLRDTGSKTFREFYRASQRVPYRYVATAVPDPNDHIEILNYAMVLGVMDIGESKTRFFRRDSERSDALTLHPHKVEEFWLWVSTWAVFLQKPSDLGFPDDGYELADPVINWHGVADGQVDAGVERDGQGKLLNDAGMGVSEQARASRVSIAARVAYAKRLIEESPDDHFVIWHDLEAERHALEQSIPGIVSVYGTQPLEEREAIVGGFMHGDIKLLAAKPSMLGSGCNLQRHCHRAIYLSVTDKFNAFIQSFHRIQRYGQTQRVRCDIIYANSQMPVLRRMRADWKRHDETMARTSAIVREHGLSSINAVERLTRSIGVTRRVECSPVGTGDEVIPWIALNNDTVDETAQMKANSVGLIVTSIPFSTQYEYTPSYNDFGHTDDKAHFFRQMDYLSPELLRVLDPGRVLAVHVKDRVRPGGYDGRSFQSIDPFHADCIKHYQAHGFVYMGMITIITDVVRENAQTYRLTWSMQCEDGSRMGVGLPEYVLLFRKAPTDATNGYADHRVEKTKQEYTKGRWQMEAHALWRSNGNRFLQPGDLVGLPWKQVFQQFRGFTLNTVYDHEAIVAIAEAMDDAAQLPPDFMLLQPASHHPDVWTDVTRMRTMNTLQAQHGREKHLCPLQFDIVDRLINRFSSPGDVVYDPFAGLMTVPYCAVKLGRRGLGVELNGKYFDDGVKYLRALDEKQQVPSLFDVVPPVEPTDEAA